MEHESEEKELLQYCEERPQNNEEQDEALDSFFSFGMGSWGSEPHKQN